VVIVDKLTYAGSTLSLEDVLGDPRVSFLHADIADRGTMTQAFAEHQPRAVMNLAAETHVDRSIDGPAAFVQTNILGTFVLLSVALAFVRDLAPAARDAFRFLHVSTDEVYGSLGPDGRFSEETPYAPNSPYAASKASADHLVRSYAQTYGLPVLTTNCSNNYGPFQFPEKLIPLMILNALDGRALPVYGDGGNVRDWLHVDDHCEGLLLVLNRGVPGEKYNLGGDNARTNLEVVDRLCDLLDQLEPPAANPALHGATSYRSLKRFVPDRPGHDRRYAIDATKVRRELGWRPRHDFDSGLRATVDWYRTHRAWCEGIQAGQYNRERLGLS
jgi:dTDP-glucose 4,6-dehydratase